MGIRRQSFHKSRGEFGREDIRHYGQQNQSGYGQVVSPYGNLPNRQAGQSYNQFANPLAAYFGLGTGQKAQREIGQVEGSDSPLAQYMRQAGAFLPQVFGQAQDVGSRIASMAPGLFDMLRQQIGAAQGQVPGIQRAAAGATGQAQQAVNQAFSPIESQALFQNALRGGLESARGGAGARGLLDAGGQQAQEETMTRDLAAQFAQSQFGQQQQALQGLQGALGSQAGLLQLGPQFAQQLTAALPGLQQALMAGYQTPMDALSQVFQQFAAYQNPNLALLGMTGPQVATRSQGGGFNVL
jgi:hypothetical protein